MSKSIKASDSIKSILQTETNPEFRKRQEQSMVVSFHKYGPIREGYPHRVNAIASLKKRLRLYEETGNADYLIDIANFAEIEFTLPAHPNYHDDPKEGNEGRYWQGGGQSSIKRNDGERN